MTNSRTLYKWNIQGFDLLIALLSTQLEYWLHTAFSLRNVQLMLKELFIDNKLNSKFVELALNYREKLNPADLRRW